MAVHVLPDSSSLAHHAAEVIAARLDQDGANLALAGGSTPARTYQALAAYGLPWGEIPVWLGDERWVPPGHEDSNAHMALTSLGESMGAGLIAMPWRDGADPDAIAEAYEALLRATLGDARGVIRPDLVMLGIGDDAHTASLFPGTAALDVRDRDYVANWVPKKGVWRLTATLPLLHRAEQILFLVSGAGKAAALKTILEGDGSTPAARVAGGARSVTWLVDEAAAAGLGATQLLRP